MEQTQEHFLECMNQLVETGKKNQHHVTIADIKETLDGFDLDPERIRLVTGFLQANQITVEGFDPEAEKNAGISQKKITSETERVELAGKKEASLSPEEKQDLDFYRESLPVPSEQFQDQRDELFKALSKGNPKAREILLEGYMGEAVQIALENLEPGFLLSDLIQEANLGLVLALDEEGADDVSVREKIREAVLSAIREENQIHDQDETILGKVTRLKDAIEQLSDGEKMDFTIGELSLFLDMSEEEIRDILNLTGEK